MIFGILFGLELADSVFRVLLLVVVLCMLQAAESQDGEQSCPLHCIQSCVIAAVFNQDHVPFIYLSSGRKITSPCNFVGPSGCSNPIYVRELKTSLALPWSFLWAHKNLS